MASFERQEETTERGPVLRLARVCKEFGRDSKRLLVLDHVGFEVGLTESVAVVGPNGSGKSTLLNMVAGFEEPTSGVIEFQGVRVAGPHRDRSMVFQQYALFPWMTVKGNVEFGLRMAGLSPEQRGTRVDAIIELVGLVGFEDYYPGALSGGMRQRAAIARALVLEPVLLLLDEPFGALDVPSRLRLQDHLVELLQQQRQTVLFVTHDVDEAIYLADRVVLLSKRPGTVREVFPVPPIKKEPGFRSDLSYQDLRAKVLEALREEADGP